MGGKNGVSKVEITSLNSHFAGIYSGTRYGFLSTWRKKTPTDEDRSLHPFKTHPKSTPVGASRKIWVGWTSVPDPTR